jgi:hypothetical protein
MEPLLPQVVRVQRKLWLGLFLNRLGQCLLVALLVAAAVIAVAKIMVFANVPSGWAPWWTAGCLGTGVAAAIVWTGCRGASPLDAAIEIDRRCRLRERVASAYLLSSENAESPAGRALAVDAARAMGRVDIDHHFSIRPNRWAWLLLLPATLVLLVALWVDPLEGGPRGSRGSSLKLASDATRQQMDVAAETLQQQLAGHRHEAARQGLKDAESLFRDLAQEVEELHDPRQLRGPKDRLVKLSDLSRQLADWRRQAGADRMLQKEFEQMKNLGHGPAKPFAVAMTEGKLDQARAAIEHLRKQLEQGGLDARAGVEEGDSGALERLQVQMERMKDQLLTATDSRAQGTRRAMPEDEQMRRPGEPQRPGEPRQPGEPQRPQEPWQPGESQRPQEPRQQGESQRQQGEPRRSGESRQQGDAFQPGGLSKSEQLQRTSNPMAPQPGREDPIRAMSRQMEACAESLRQGDRQGATEALGKLARQVDQMGREKAMNDLRDSAFSQIQAAKDAISGRPCSSCQGSGCSRCKPPSSSQSPAAASGQDMAKNGLSGKQPGSGAGLRRDQPNPTEFVDVPVPINRDSAAEVLARPVAGPNLLGEVTETIKREMADWKGNSADPLVFERLPRSHREHAEQYFNKIREGR